MEKETLTKAIEISEHIKSIYDYRECVLSRIENFVQTITIKDSCCNNKYYKSSFDKDLFKKAITDTVSLFYDNDELARLEKELADLWVMFYFLI